MPVGVSPKAREARMARLAQLLEGGKLDPPAALELLVSEAQADESHPELWERLHAVAEEQDKVFELASAYHQLATGKRLRQVDPAKQAEILLHGADLLQGLLGDPDGATELLVRIHSVFPDHPEVFSRLERRFTDRKENRRLAELYARVASAHPDKSVLLLGRALTLIETLAAGEAIADEICEGLVQAASVNRRVLTVVEAHCKRTGRTALACSLVERAIAQGGLEPETELELRRRMLVAYSGDAKRADAALPHVERLLDHDPTDAGARAAAEQLLKHPSVATRAAAALQEARRRNRPPPSSRPPRPGGG